MNSKMDMIYSELDFFVLTVQVVSQLIRNAENIKDRHMTLSVCICRT